MTRYRGTGLEPPTLSFADIFDDWEDDFYDFYVNRLHMHEGRTAPPTPLTETELITDMDRNGIGTDATVAQHISTIQVRPLPLFHPYFTPISPLFHPYFTPISRLFDAHFTPISRLFHLYFDPSLTPYLTPSSFHIPPSPPQPIHPPTQSRDYASKDAQNRFVPTPLGLAMVEGYTNMGLSLAKHYLRAAMEQVRPI